MSIIKLERNGKVIERLKTDYEANKATYELRGFKEFVKKPAPKPKAEKPKEEPKKDSEWVKEEAPKKTETKKAE